MCALKYRKIINFIEFKLNIRLETSWCIHAAAYLILWWLILIQSSNEFKTYLKMLLEIYLEKEKKKRILLTLSSLSFRPIGPAPLARWSFPPRQPPAQPPRPLGPASRASPTREQPLAQHCALNCTASPAPRALQLTARARVSAPPPTSRPARA